MANFVVMYAPWRGLGTSAAIDDVSTMWRGPSATRSRGRNAFTVLAVPTTFTDSSHCQSSAVMRSSGPNCMTPTLAATTLRAKAAAHLVGRGVEAGAVGDVDRQPDRGGPGS